MARFSLARLIDTERLIHSFKTVIACFVALIVTRLVGFTAGQWIVITIIVVMCSQIYVGSVLQKAYFRFLGTLIGCLFAAVAIISLGANNLSIAVAIGASAFIFSYIATGWENLTYAGTLGAVTTTIIMLGQAPTLLFAFERFLEISIGILIAGVVSQFILPIHARTHLRRAQALTLEQLRNYYDVLLVNEKPKDPDFDYHDLDENIVKSLFKQRQLAKESKREPLGRAFDPAHFMQVLYAEREILRAITYMHTAMSQIRPSTFTLQNTPAYKEFNLIMMQGLETLSHAIEADEPQKSHIHIPSLQALKTVIQSNKENYSEEDYYYMNSFLFSAEILIKNLLDIAKLYGVSV